MAFGATNSPGFSPSGDGIKIWAANTSYAVDDFVYHSGKLYHVDTAFTSGSTFSATNMTQIGGDGGSGFTEWATSTAYAVGQYVVYDGQIYKCTTAHTSAVWSGDVANWSVISGLQTWAANGTFYAGTLLYHGDTLYHVDNTFTAGATFDDDDLTPICKGGGWQDWATATAYEVGDYVVHGTQIYRCLTAHTSDVWSTDIANWEIISGTPTWTAGETYIEGEIIYHDKQLYYVDITQTAGSVFDETNLTPIGGAGGGAKLANVENATATAGVGEVTLTWTDPPNVVISGATVAEWGGTRVVRKVGSAPANKNDGDIIVDSVVKDEYSVTGFVDTNVTNGTTYFYRWFPYTTAEAYTSGTALTATPNFLDPEFEISSDNITLAPSTSMASADIEATFVGGGTISATSSNTAVCTVSVNGNTVTISNVAVGSATVTISLSQNGDYASATATVTVTSVSVVKYGYKISKTEADPYERVTYLYDAVGKTPAYMDFENGKFNMGDWGHAWFVELNKPCMLKSDGTVDYYLKPDNYDYREDGETASDVSNTSYDGNAMSEIPLCYVYRYEDADYCYEIVSNVQVDENYKAYAHTRADGSIADAFYWSMFGGSGSASKIRSLAGQTLVQSLTATQEIAGCQANGSKWYTHTWSQHELLRTLCVLMGKSTDTQAVFGNGNIHEATSASGLLATGTLKASGQFFGYNDSTHQVKVFHIEKFWGDQWDRIAGLINNKGPIYVKMTPEGDGYRVTDVTGYTNTGLTAPSDSGAYISAVNMSENGAIPSNASGSSTTYYPDIYSANNGKLAYLIVGVCANYAVAFGGGFSFAVFVAPSDFTWAVGCGLTCEKPA